MIKILIDSQHAGAEGIKRALETAGYQADLALQRPNGEAERTGYDFIITDAPGVDGILKNGNITLDTARHLLKRNKKTVKVTPLEFRIIGFFITHAGEIVTKDALAAGCWPSKKVVSGNTIEVYIKRIRNKLGASSIRTIHGIGYQMDKKSKIA